MTMKKRILILCTGNSCRSQMAEGFLRSFDPSLEVFSAGTRPSGQIHPKAVQVMKEKGIDISMGFPKNVESFISESFDMVITVCDHARETCPVFTGKVEQKIHLGFEDPAEVTGTEEEILSAFRTIRDQIETRFRAFYLEELGMNE
jgi:arsenate reductase (thioredoxin)